MPRPGVPPDHESNTLATTPPSHREIGYIVLVTGGHNETVDAGQWRQSRWSRPTIGSGAHQLYLMFGTIGLYWWTRANCSQNMSVSLSCING